MSFRTKPGFGALLQCCFLMIIVLRGDISPGDAQDLPIFDAHIHYSQPDLAVFAPEQVLAILDRAGVRHALVSSTPDDGTLKLYAKAPERIVSSLRPYRSREDMLTWHSDPAVQTCVEERLSHGVYNSTLATRLLTEIHGSTAPEPLEEIAATLPQV